MSANFEKLKRRYRLSAIIISIAVGVSFGIIVPCVMLTAFKATGVQFFWAYYIPIAIGAAAVTGVPLYFALRPTDKKLAKRLDERYGLDQKVQTMVEYEGEGGTMPKLQREQADAAVGAAANVSAASVVLGRLLYFIAVPVIALAMLLLGIFYPVKKQAEIPPPAFDMTENQLLKLRNLIEDVKSSDLEEPLSNAVCLILEELATDLGETELQSDMYEKVYLAVDLIDGVFAAKNTYLRISTAMVAEEKLSALSYAISDAANYFGGGDANIGSMTVVANKAETAEEDISAKLGDWVSGFAETLGELDGVNAISTYLSEFAASIQAKLLDLEDDAEDGLYGEVKSLSETFAALAGKSGNYADSEAGKNTYVADVSAAGETFSLQAARAIMPQSYNLTMNIYVRRSLASIFKVTAPHLVTEVADPEADPNDPDKPVVPPHGPDGEDVFGSDDLIYDHETGEQVKYKDVIQKYKDRVLDKIEKGESSEELAQYIRSYFDVLDSYQGKK